MKSQLKLKTDERMTNWNDLSEIRKWSQGIGLNYKSLRKKMIVFDIPESYWSHDNYREILKGLGISKMDVLYIDTPKGIIAIDLDHTKSMKKHKESKSI